ncbi:MAG: hypothetical protein E7340_02575 [Clostridiales bacterium]|nr:hypothetical protein [Clostridiales bacterium]
MTKETKRRVGIVGNIVAIIVCLTMLLGTTFAWFTDSETNSGNVISSGSLNVEAYWEKGTENPANADWKDLNAATAVYNYDKWEPGYVSARHFKIANEGSLAFKYKLVIVPNGAVSALAEVIDVYYVNPAVQLSDRANLSSDLLVGTLADLIADPDGAAYGKLLSGESETATVAFKMRESAGNDYYDMSIGSTFDIKVIATQYASESDDLGTDYDKDAIFADYYVTTADELIEALENAEEGEAIALMSDVKIDPASMSNAYGTTGINIKKGQIFDGNGYTLDIAGAGGTWDSGISITGGTVKNITVTGAFRGIFINHNSTEVGKVILENVITDGTVYTISCDQGTNNGLEAINCTFKGWTSYAKTLGNAKFVNCYFGEGSGYSFCRPYAQTEFVGCKFEAGFEMDPRAAVTFENCTLDGVAITGENLSTLVTSNINNATIK